MTRTSPSPGLIGRALLGLLAAMLVVSTAAAGHASPTPNPDLRQPPWQPLGPLGPRRVDALAVSPDWPKDKLLLGARNSGEEHAADLVRTRDGGRTWEALPSPAGRLVALLLAPTQGGGPIAFAWSEQALFRSPDAGTTWQQVLAAQDAKIDDTVLSPSFGQDGLAFVLAGGALWRSRDSGAHWDRLDPVPGQFVHRVRFSPDHAADAAVFLGLAGGPFPIGGPAGTIDPAPAGDPDSSAGVVVSTDAGDSWTPINAGLQVDGQGYQAIQELEVSPTFARDGTLFALGWGPFETVTFFDTEVPGQRAALFRSQDRGASWESIQTFGPSVTRFHLQVAPSPYFADDHIVLEAISVTGPTPSSSHCTVAWSDDAGSSWTEKLRPGTYEACSFLQLFGADAGFEATVLKSASRLWSPDGGRTWGYASSPSSFEPIVSSPTYSQDRTLFAGGLSGVWSIGAGVQATNGMLPCPVSPMLGFGRVWGGNVEVRQALGCASQPERPITLRERDYVNQYCGPTRVLWPDDPALTVFYELSNSSCGPNSLAAFDKATSEPRLPDVPEQVMRGAVQPFEGGLLLFLSKPDGERSIVVLPASGPWREYPD